MLRIGNGKVFICILISLLMNGLTWNGWLPDISESNQQANTLDSGPFQESPPGNNESDPAQYPLWQVNQNNTFSLQSNTEKGSNKVLVKTSSNIRGVSYHGYSSTDSESVKISHCIVQRPDTFLKYINIPVYLHLDIPPPHNSAAL